MALIEISECVLKDEDTMDALIDHFDGWKELRYLRKPHIGTKTFYIESAYFEPSEMICPVIKRLKNGELIILRENL